MLCVQLKIWVFHYYARKTEWVLGDYTVPARVTLSKYKLDHVTLLKIVEKLPTHSAKPLQCPIGPYMS